MNDLVRYALDGNIAVLTVDNPPVNALGIGVRTGLKECIERAIADGRGQVWVYACDGPGKTLSPDRYYRRLSWFAFHHGATGAGFWAYADLRGESHWNDFDGPDHSFVLRDDARAEQTFAGIVAGAGGIGGSRLG